MKIAIKLKSGSYYIDTKSPLDISVPMDFRGLHPVAWGAPKASANTYIVEGFTGNTQQGGSCNVEEYRFIPHCHGTHTECVGHISNHTITIHNILKETFIPSTLISIKPKLARDVIDQYIPTKNNEDLFICKQSLVEKLTSANVDFTTGLIIRTIPNSQSKKYRDYMAELPPFFSIDAIEYIISLKVKHLLVDLPSVDRTFDQGYLTVHRKFWNVPLNEHNINPNDCSLNTISEMIYVPDEIPDGYYLLNLQIPAFITDVAPSRPFLYKIQESISP